MSGMIEVISVGVQSLIQDKGRWGVQEYGIPTCGTVVPHWMVLGNTLVGNNADCAGIEFRLMGPTLKAFDKPVKIAVCGDVSCDVISRSEGGTATRSVSGWRSFTLHPGDEVKVGSLQGTSAGFIALSGGLDVKKEFGSVATYVRSAIGGLNGRALQVGDRLTLGQGACETDRVLPAPPIRDDGPVRVVLGPQADYFTDQAIADFLQSPYVISAAMDRMGARLDGKKLQHKGEKEIVSDGIAPGAVQVPGNGLPIVLLNDAQTVGGYPKIATVVSADLHKIANGLPGDEIRFEQVDVVEACLIAREEADRLEKLKRSIIAASADGFIDLKALYENNLVDGVVDMANPDHLEKR